MKIEKVVPEDYQVVLTLSREEAVSLAGLILGVDWESYKHNNYAPLPLADFYEELHVISATDDTIGPATIKPWEN